MQRLEKSVSLITVSVVLLYFTASCLIKSSRSITPFAQADEKAFSVAEDKIYQAQLVNINTADRHALARLKGIGLKLAERIIDYRNTHGAFKRADEIMLVKGIGEKKYQVISGMIAISD
jgi:competence ComEA-like helix-hairpin-helix protein